MTMSETKVAVITGSNSGVGLATAKRLVDLASKKNLSLTTVLACRDMGRAKAAQSEILAAHPSAVVELLQLDTSELKSVMRAARDIAERYGRLDYLYLNAGILPVVQGQFYWDTLMTTDIKHILHVLATCMRITEGLLVQRDWKTKDGFNSVFETNLLGHFLLIQETEHLLAASKARIIWTGSTAANKKSFDMNNIQHTDGLDPYGSSKYALDLVNLALNKRLNPKGVYSYTCCPGLVMTGVAYGIMPQWVWMLLIVPLLMLMRIIEPFYTLWPYNGAEGNVRLSGIVTSDEPNLVTSMGDFNGRPAVAHADPFVKYYSRTSVLGHQYIVWKAIDGSVEEGEEVYEMLDKMTAPYRS